VLIPEGSKACVKTTCCSCHKGQQRSSSRSVQERTWTLKSGPADSALAVFDPATTAALAGLTFGVISSTSIVSTLSSPFLALGGGLLGGLGGCPSKAQMTSCVLCGSCDLCGSSSTSIDSGSGLGLTIARCLPLSFRRGVDGANALTKPGS
jgi:hypothetical protein